MSELTIFKQISNSSQLVGEPHHQPVQLPASATSLPQNQTESRQHHHQQNQTGHERQKATTIGPSDSYNFWRTEQITVAWIILITIVIGNSSILYKLKFSRRRKSNINYFIIHLALADLLVGLVSVSTDIAWRYSVGFYYGLWACKSIKFLQVLVTYSSTYLLVALSVDRWEAVARPLIFARKQRHGRYLVGGAWLFSAIFAIPTGYVFEIKRIQQLDQCWITFTDSLHWQLYMVFHATILFAIPALIITACYVWIVYTIWKKGRCTTTTTTTTTSTDIGLDTSSSRKKSSVPLCGMQMSRPTTIQSPTSTPTPPLSASPDLANLTNAVVVGGGDRQPQRGGQRLDSNRYSRQDSSDKTTTTTSITTNKDKDNYDYFAIKFMESRRNQLAGTSGTQMTTNNNNNNNNSSQHQSFDCATNKSRVSGGTNKTSVDLQHSATFDVELEEITNNLDNNNDANKTRKNNNHDNDKTPVTNYSSSSSNNYGNHQATNYSIQQQQQQQQEDRSTRQHGSGVIPKARIKTIKMTLVIVFAFIVCWLPYMVCSVGQVFGFIESNNPVTTFIQSLVHLNSAVNPMIFWIFSGDCNSALDNCILRNTLSRWLNCLLVAMRLRSQQQETITQSQQQQHYLCDGGWWWCCCCCCCNMSSNDRNNQSVCASSTTTNNITTNLISINLATSNTSQSNSNINRRQISRCSSSNISRTIGMSAAPPSSSSATQHHHHKEPLLQDREIATEISILN